MRIVGWLASGLGIVGVVVSNGLASVVWLLLFEVRKRTHRLLAIPEDGLERAVELTTSVESQLTTSSQSVGDILAKADALAKAPKLDAAAAQDLARRDRRLRHRTVRRDAHRVRDAPGARCLHRRCAGRA